ncbi:MAG TPA: transporter substrate-binding domain-containing protein, partial [bacterium]|nr:transporter substrate-binding domain-containing protein [bacterium]
ILFSTILTDARRDSFTWVGPIAATDYVLLARAGEADRYADEPAQRAARIATISQYASELLLRQRGYARLVSGPDAATGLRRLMNGEVELLAVSTLTLPRLLADAGVAPGAVAVAATLSTDRYYFAFSRGSDPAAAAAWQAALDGLKRDGRFARMHDQWLPAAAAPGIMTLITEENPPVNYTHDGRITGYAPELVRELQRRVGNDDELQMMAWPRGYDLALHHPQVALFTTARTPERETLFHWVGPIAATHAVLYQRRGTTPVPDLAAAARLGKIATISGWANETALRRQGFTNLASCTSAAAAVQLLMQGEAQAVLLYDLTMAGIMREAQLAPDELQPAVVLDETDLYIALSRSTPAATVQAWREQCAAMVQDGTIDRLRRRWLQ